MPSSNFSPKSDLPPLDVVFGTTAPMQELRASFERIARSGFPVLITGESGTGKEVFAHLLHQLSGTPSAPFVKLNCPAIPTGLVESELFGHEKGAFTDATCTRRGRIEMAHGGVLFLDEVGELEAAVQAKLLQMLQDGTFSRLGGEETRKVKVRLISATNRDLRAAVQTGLFREDIFHRMNAFHIHLLPLRSRIADLAVLLEYFRDANGRILQRQIPPVTSHLFDIMAQYSWPGNIRELENVVRRYAVLGSEESIVADLLQENDAPSLLNAEIHFDGNRSLKQITKGAVRDLERQIIYQVLQANHWNRKSTAKILGISYRSLFYKLREVGFSVEAAPGRDEEQAFDAPPTTSRSAHEEF